MTSLDIPMNDESTSHTHSQPTSSSSTEQETHNTRSSSSSATSSLGRAQQPSSQATSWTRMDMNNEENSGAEQVEMRKMNSFELVHRHIPSRQLPLSPPLTRVPSNGSTSARIPAPPLENDDEVQGLEEVDIANHHWPLERSQSLEKEDDLSLHDHDSLHIGSATNEKRRSRTNRRPALLNLEFRKPSPQPWDNVDPPPENNGRLELGYYSPPPHSTTYLTQQNARRRPLIPHSAYYIGPPASDSAYGTPPVGQIGVHHPREIVRIERDYAGGELVQFSSIYPIELDGRITPTQFLDTINDINEILISAHSSRHSFIHNFFAVVTLHLSTFFLTPHYDKEMRRLKCRIDEMNTQIYNPVGLNILWPRNVAFLFLEIEYY
ncbi:hypothetical protein K503DRAFT_862940 [Rhizopogon vinicolor AM-OR11-026]|uniref:Ras modification protein ERF4 n=1 Tax=Rhizopogon vinicolor AM-OR11-026 TaxID=1314800 RepID=A0A1B7NCH5_9AGAM|nr:hypothetical protein K503DRAFT_862940 [Rhizopogon vinicolor AM-OR11-026]